MASGNTLLIFHAYSNEPPASNFATLDTRNLHPVLDFDASTDESAVFGAVMPRGYAGNGVTLYIHYAMTSATSGYVVWEAAFERIGDEQQDIDSDSFAATNYVQDTVPTTSGNVGIATITFTNGADMDSVAAGEGFRLKVVRDADSTNATDDATGDAELFWIEVKET
jgi:hypothetical protein